MLTLITILIVEGHAEDGLGQWAKNGVIGEQGCRPCLWTWYDTEGVWQSRPYKGPQLQMNERKTKWKAQKVHPKRSERAVLGDEQAQDSEFWSEEDFVW